MLGYYDDTTRQVVVALGLTMVELRATLAHELSHAYYGHPCSKPAHERMADRRAARLLVDPRAYRAAEAIDPDPHFIAAELGLTPSVIRTWREHWLPCHLEQEVSRYA
ncbi:MAG: ImmA/IrrE family metallo-endopeptidase [Naasia sp.]|nr:ImmA/IrrE family metallo-endopeptidase [Naasia sp.]